MMNGFEMHKVNEVTYFTIPSFNDTGLVKSCFTTKTGGISQGSYEALNLGFKTEDSSLNVIENYRLICQAIDIPLDHVVMSDQIHSDHIRIIKEDDKGKGILYQSDIVGIDALITNQKDIALTTIYADCVPLFFLDPEKKVIALAHAGWKGTMLKIGAKVIKRMVEEFQSNPQDCLAAIGPSIGSCCYEVDEFVIGKFNENFTNLHRFVYSNGNGKYMLNLWEANKFALEEIGILERNITMSNLCTQCNKDLFFSYRADKGVTGRMAAILQLL